MCGSQDVPTAVSYCRTFNLFYYTFERLLKKMKVKCFISFSMVEHIFSLKVSPTNVVFYTFPLFICVFRSTATKKIYCRQQLVHQIFWQLPVMTARYNHLIQFLNKLWPICFKGGQRYLSDKLLSRGELLIKNMALSNRIQRITLTWHPSNNLDWSSYQLMFFGTAFTVFNMIF